MALTKVTAGVIAANAVVDSFGSQSITGDKIGLTAINANNIVDSSITSGKIVSVANNQLTGTITATQLAANSVNATILQTSSIENYMATSGRPLTNRNLVINGAMQVAQRGTSNTGITSSGYYTADRWYTQIDTAGTWTMNVESSAPTNTEFRKSANVICTTANSSLAAGKYFLFQQRFEGQNVQNIKKGTTNAESLTVSFWVKSSNTGTYICELRELDNSRQISKSYTIDAADTWEKKTITVPPDTIGQLDNDNAHSIQLTFWLAAGTDFTSGTLNSSTWASNTSANRAVGQLNLANATGNYWAVTGIQLETGTVATPYEWMDYGTELLKCQRYYQRLGQASYVGIGTGNGIDNTNANITVRPTVEMRAGPTVSYDSLVVTDRGYYDKTVTAIASSHVSPSGLFLFLTVSGGGTMSYADAVHLCSVGGYAGSLSLNAEL